MGNKNDCPDRKVVLYEDAKRFADQMNIKLFETSAKDNINVEEVRDIGNSLGHVVFINFQLVLLPSVTCRSVQ